MDQPEFFQPSIIPTLADVVAWTGARASHDADLSKLVRSLAPLDDAGPGALSFLDNPKYAVLLPASGATACLLSEKYAGKVAGSMIALICSDPYRAYSLVAGKMFPATLKPDSNFGASGISPGSFVHPTARLEEKVIVDPGATIGPFAAIGTGTVIGAGVTIGPHVQIGRDCNIGASSTVQYTLAGDRVILHPGVRLGQDGFGFAMGASGHAKVPQMGRVVIQNDVEIGANSTIDRGANRDTIIGEGTKIDNQVQIGHNATIGRHCVIVAHVGISGSTEIGDLVAIGGQAGIAGHLKIGDGAQIAAQSGVMSNVPAGETWGGSPARPIRDVMRSQAILARFAKQPPESQENDE